MSNEDEFTYPPRYGAGGEYISNLEFIVGDTITLQWESSATDDLTFWLVQDATGKQCQFQSNAECVKIADSPNNGSTPWTVSRMDMRNSDIYYITAFNISDPFNGAVQPHFNTHYINITDAGSSSSSSSFAAFAAPSTSSTPTSSSTTSSTPTTTTNTESTPTPAPTQLSSSNSNSNVAVGVGVGVGVPLGIIAIALLTWLILRHFRRKFAQAGNGAAGRMPVSELMTQERFEKGADHPQIPGELEGYPVTHSTNVGRPPGEMQT
ncbi:hypothetical protein K402DRAFT_425002 [Aulographum hederae CBS 113979]|uniref:Mid2 domain-containing protein n=1 Tax=Aulographum hederae CBS 113979 TaxID=1176131 RepID=A0A6G1GME4_9PEZI|nr:hypothetical protein K402DRAFT_425002 [Aulographum hederae CBS 113979]